MVTVGLFASLFLRLWFLQVAAVEENTAKASSNQVQVIYQQPARGEIRDINGTVLAASRPSQTLQLDRGDVTIEQEEELVQRLQSLQLAHVASLAGFQGFDERITTLRARIQSLQPRIDSALRTQGRYLEDIAVAELEERKRRLGLYLVQARFGLAQIYDQATEPAEVAQ